MMLRERWSRKVSFAGSDECWLWTGAAHPNGRGKMNIDGRTRYATHVALELHGTPVPPGSHVCHHCDMPACVNPAHLFVGTHVDNMRDKKQKGRDANGERNGAAKLTEAAVSQIRREFADGRRQCDIAADHRVSRATVSLVVRNRIWAS